MTSELQQFRYDNLIRRVGGIIGPGSKVAEVLTELFPVIDVENVPGELLWLMGTQLAWGGAGMQGEVAETSRIELFNAVDSGKIVVITDVVISVDVDSGVLWTLRNSALPDTDNNERLRDTRLSTDERPTTTVRTQSAAGFTVATNNIDLLAKTPFTMTDPNGIAILFPGTGMEVGMLVQQKTIRVSFRWRERIFERSEITGV